MPGDTVHACLIVDDFPANASYWWREQQTAFGYKPPDTGLFGTNWRAQAKAPFFPVALVRKFADFVEEFDVKGKFTLLPCPAGLGRLDRSVRGYSDGELKELLDLVRERIAPRFDITPEVLTHSMAFDPKAESLLPHAETAWVTHLSATGRQDELREYLRFGFAVLKNVGIAARGVTIGGIPDPSGIAEGELLTAGHHREGLAEALIAVEREFDPRVSTTFAYSGAPPVTEAGRTMGVPETIYTTPDGACVFGLRSDVCGDPLLHVFHGQDAVEAETDKLVSADLASGILIECAEAGRPVVFTVHSQTLNSLNTAHGFLIVREAVRRLNERYGRRLLWQTPLELFEAVGEKTPPRGQA